MFFCFSIIFNKMWVQLLKNPEFNEHPMYVTIATIITISISYCIIAPFKRCSLNTLNDHYRDLVKGAVISFLAYYNIYYLCAYVVVVVFFPNLSYSNWLMHTVLSKVNPTDIPWDSPAINQLRVNNSNISPYIWHKHVNSYLFFLRYMQTIPDPPVSEIKYNANLTRGENHERYLDWRDRTKEIKTNLYLSLARYSKLDMSLKGKYSQKYLQANPVDTLKGPELWRALSYLEGMNINNRKSGINTNYNRHTPYTINADYD